MSVTEKVFVSMNAGRGVVTPTSHMLSIRHVKTVMELDKWRVIMTEELERELRMLGVLDQKTPAVEIDAEPIWIRDDVVFDEDGQPNF